MKQVNFEIIIGTYEEFVVGYRFDSSKKELAQSFASHSHNSSVRCVASSSHYLASGGADDRIVIYDLKSRKEHTMLTYHNGTVNCVQFTKGHTHLISGGADGMLALVRVGNWHLEKTWEKAHKGSSIIDVAVHPSNKLALTLGADCTLRTWNLIKGRQAYIINLNSKVKDPKSLQFIKWAPDGVRFILCAGCQTDIWSIETGGVLKPIEHKNKISYCLFYDNDNLIIGFENGYLSMLNLNENSSTEIDAHTARIKCIDICKGYLVTCSSNGEVKIWNKSLEKIATCSTGCRQTSVCVVLPTWIKKEEDDDVAEEVVIAEASDEGIDRTVIKSRKKKLRNKEQVDILIESNTPKRKKKLQQANNESVLDGMEDTTSNKKNKQKLKHKDKSAKL